MALRLTEILNGLFQVRNLEKDSIRELQKANIIDFLFILQNSNLA